MNTDCRNRHPYSDFQRCSNYDLCAPANFEKLQYIILVCVCVCVFVHIFYSFRCKRKSNLQAFFFNGHQAQALRRGLNMSFNRYNIMCLKNARLKSVAHITNVKIIII